jgi:hypothetical protein
VREVALVTRPETGPQRERLNRRAWTQGHWFAFDVVKCSPMVRPRTLPVDATGAETIRAELALKMAWAWSSNDQEIINTYIHVPWMTHFPELEPEASPQAVDNSYDTNNSAAHEREIMIIIPSCSV